MIRVLIIGLVTSMLSADSMLQYDGETTGYFDGTKIIRYLDKKYNIVCYELTPLVINTSRTYSSSTKKSETIFKGDLGSLSCVKLFPFSK